MKHYKIKFEKLPIIYKAWFLYIQKIFQKFNNINHKVMKKYNIKINNMINPADFFIIIESDDGIPAPNGKKYYLENILLTSNIIHMIKILLLEKI